MSYFYRIKNYQDNKLFDNYLMQNKYDDCSLLLINEYAENFLLNNALHTYELNTPRTDFSKLTEKQIKDIDSNLIVNVNIKDIDSKRLEYILRTIVFLINNKKDKIKVFNIYPQNSDNYNDVKHTIIAMYKDSRKKRYEYIYDVVCDELDEDFVKNNYCDFQNDRCIANREGASAQDTMGCCYSFRYTKFGDIKDKRLCKYFDNEKKCCSTKCMTCKLFTCRYLRERGVRFKASDIILLKVFFDKKQLRVLSCNYFIPKEKLIDKLMEDSKKPYFLYYLTNSEYIEVEL